MRKRRQLLKKNISILQRENSNLQSIEEPNQQMKIDTSIIRKHLTFTKRFNQSNNTDFNRNDEPLSVQPMIIRTTQHLHHNQDLIFQNLQHEKQSKEFNLNEEQIPSFKIKITSLMKVLYKSMLYIKINILVNIVYMFGVFIQLPDKMCYKTDDFSFRCGLSHYIQVICLLIICPLFMIKVLRMVGIDSFKCIIELVTFVCGILWMFRPLIILRYLKMIRPLRILMIIRDTSLIVPTYNMFTSVRSISKVLFPAILTIYIYAIIGLYTFSDNEYERCRDPNVVNLDHGWSAYEEQIYLCGQRSCPVVNGTQFQCLNPIDYGVQPDSSELQHIQFGNGLIRYSNIFLSFFLTYQNTFITGSTNTVLLQKSVVNSAFVQVYYYSFIYLLSFFYFNIFFGLMIVNQDDHLQTKQQYEALTDNVKQIRISDVQKKLIRKYERIFNKLNKRISLLPSTNKKIPNLLYQTQKNLSSANQISMKRSGCNLDIDTIQQAAAEHQTTKKILGVVQNIQSLTQTTNLTLFEKLSKCIKKVYYYFNISIAILACINICLEHANQSDQLQTFMNIFDIIFFVLFFLDFLVRYIIIVSKNQENNQKQLVVKIPRRIYLQGILLSICMTGYLYEMVIAENFIDFYLANTKVQKIFRAMLYLRILIILSFEPYFEESRKILFFVFEAVKKSVDFIFLWLIVLIMFSMMGYFLFGQCNSDLAQECYSSKIVYNTSYQGIFESMITLGIIMLNEDWDTIMQELFLQHGYLIVIWNFLVITFGIMIFSKYFMSYLLNELDTKISENFDKQNQEKVQQKSFLQDLMKKDIDSSSNKSQFDQNLDQIYLKNENLLMKESVKIEKNKDPKINEIMKQEGYMNENGEEGKSEKKVNFRYNKVVPQFEDQIKIAKTQVFPRRKIQFRKKKQKTKHLDELKIYNINVQKQHNQVIQNEKPQQFSSIEHAEQKKTTLTKKISMKKIKFEQKQQKMQKDPNQQLHQDGNYYTESVWYITVKSIVLIVLIINIFQESPQNAPDSNGYLFSYYCSVIVDSFFIIDMVGQFFAYGLKSWFLTVNISRYFDLGLNIISILYFTPLGYHYVIGKLYAFRCFRVSFWINLRFQSSQQMRVTAKGFVQLIPKILKLLFVIWLIYGFFANIIVRIYKEEMWQCVNFPLGSKIETKTDCLNYGGDWVEDKLNANNFGQALLYIFLLASTQDWMNTMNDLSEIKGKDMQPFYTASSLLRIFFMVFMFFANVVVMNIFVGVCINNFKQNKKKVTGETNLSRQQKQWVNVKNQIYLLQPEPIEKQPENELRKFCYKIAKSKAILFIKVFQLVGLLLLFSFITTNMPKYFRSGILIGQYSFLLMNFCIFLIDLIAVGIKKQNLRVRVLQFFLYIYGIVFLLLLALSSLSKHDQRMAGGILVFIQLLRNFLFIQQFEFFQKMFNSLMTILPKTKDIFLLMITTLFIYTTIGMQIFGYLKPGEQINQENGDYATFGSALFTLTKFSIYQNAVQQIRDGLTSLSPNSVCFDIFDYESFAIHGQNGCGYTVITLFYYISFNLIFSLILLPTLMGIIFDEYNECFIEENTPFNKFQLLKIKKAWQEYDPEGKGYINCKNIWLMASKINKVFKLKSQKLLNHLSKQRFLTELNLPIYEDDEGIYCFQFHELIQAFIRTILLSRQKNAKKKEVLQKNIPFHYEVNNKNQILKKLKKTSYKSCHFHTLFLLKSGLQSWKNKVTNHPNFVKNTQKGRIKKPNNIQENCDDS